MKYVHTEQLVGHDLVDRAGARVIDLDERAVLAAKVNKAKVVVDHVGIVAVSPKAYGCGLSLLLIPVTWV